MLQIIIANIRQKLKLKRHGSMIKNHTGLKWSLQISTENRAYFSRFAIFLGFPWFTCRLQFIPHSPTSSVSLVFISSHQVNKHSMLTMGCSIHLSQWTIPRWSLQPAAEPVDSNSFQAKKERLKHIFTTYETPRRLESNGGPPFNIGNARGIPTT